MKRKIISQIRDLNVKGSGRTALWLAKLLLGEPKGKLAVKTIYDFALNIDPVTDNGVERSLYYYGTYEKGTLAIMGEILQKGDVFVDVGANIGLMSVYASKKIGPEGSVIAFEPNPKTRALLNSNLGLNEIENVKTEAFALSDKTKKGRIYDRWDINRGGASLIEPSKATDSYEIEEIKFTDYFNRSDRIKLVKIDVEGYELNVLKGAKPYLLESPSPPALIVEFSISRTNTFGEDTTPLFTFLKELSRYRFFRSAGGKEKDSRLIEIKDKSDLPEHDNVFCLTEKHLNELPNRIFETIPGS